MFLIGVQKLAMMLSEFLSNQPVFAMICYTGTIFNATSLQIVLLKIVQYEITSTETNNMIRAVEGISKPDW